MKINFASKKVWIPLVVLAGLVIAFAIIFPSIYCTVLSVNLKMTAAQVEETQKIHVEWDTSEPVDKVDIKVFHDGKLVSEEVTTDAESIMAGETDVDGFYGRMTVKVTIKKGIYSTTRTKKVNLSASEYNIAPLTATMPVTIFTLSLSDITKDGEIPTFVWFKRSSAWDWSSLLDNIHPIPVASTHEFMESGEEKMYKETTKWIKELHEINPESKFHLFYNDYFAYGWVQATIANGIPTENYDVVMLSDGTASFSYFNKHFDNENADAEYDKMAARWAKLKKDVAKKGKYNKNTNVAIDAGALREYAYVMATEEENVQWWLTRISGTLANSNADFYAKVAANANVKVKDLNTLMSAVKEKSDTDYLNVEKVKNLYLFNDDMFEEASIKGKKIMVILGTWGVGVDNEPLLKEYTKALMAYYGDDYIYYYKGHPKYPTNSINGKLEQLESYGLTDVDSTIPAELIYFFNPDAYFSGYSSSTFGTVDAEHSCAVFNHTLDSFNSDSGTVGYRTKIDFTMSQAMLSGIQIDGVQFTADAILLQFNKTAEGVEEHEYDIALFQNNQMRYYKLNGESYTQVEVA